jgi:hypothetical protein
LTVNTGARSDLLTRRHLGLLRHDRPLARSAPGYAGSMRLPFRDRLGHRGTNGTEQWTSPSDDVDHLSESFNQW